MRLSPQLDASRYNGQSGAEQYFRSRQFTRKKEFNQKCCSYCVFEEKRSSRQPSLRQGTTFHAQMNTQKRGFTKSIFACKANHRRPTIALYSFTRKYCEAKRDYFGSNSQIANANANFWDVINYVCNCDREFLARAHFFAIVSQFQRQRLPLTCLVFLGFRRCALKMAVNSRSEDRKTPQMNEVLVSRDASRESSAA